MTSNCTKHFWEKGFSSSIPNFLSTLLKIKDDDSDTFIPIASTHLQVLLCWRIEKHGPDWRFIDAAVNIWLQEKFH